LQNSCKLPYLLIGAFLKVSGDLLRLLHGCCTGLGRTRAGPRSGTWFDELNLSTQSEGGCPTGTSFPPVWSTILLVDQDLIRRSAPRQLLRRRHRLGFGPVHACGSPGPLSFHLPPFLLLSVGPHEVGLHLALGGSARPSASKLLSPVALPVASLSPPTALSSTSSGPRRFFLPIVVLSFSSWR
jgi:hypothetical protein